MTNEIGSEFWAIPTIDRRYLLSGRTALDFIIRDIIYQYGYKKVLLPSYCCHTMIEPFARNGFSIRFYDVYFDKQQGFCADVPEPEANEVFYFMKYFGFSTIKGLECNDIRKAWSLIIEDCTHSWMSLNETIADYTYTSYRKWAGFSGISEATKTTGQFSVNVGETNKTYNELRKAAMELKEKYIFDGSIDKFSFLQMYSDAENLLEKDYVGYSAAEECIQKLLTFDKCSVRNKRIANAKCLMAELRGVKEVKLMFDNINDSEVPLFVPILVDSNRDELRRFLTGRKIYCPVHWTISEYHDGISDKAKAIYEKEFSLICDQRYEQEDMKYIAKTIIEFFEGK